MHENIRSVLPINIQKFIRIQVTHLVQTAYFSYQDSEDLEQELWLFYLQKLEILRVKRRQMHYSQQYINEEFFSFFETESTKNIDDKEVVSKMLKNLTLKEQDCLLMIMGGANIRETSRLLNVSKESIYKILKKLKENFEN